MDFKECYLDDKQQSQAQSDGCKIKMALDGTVSFREPLGQIRQGETLNHQGAITHEICCLAAQVTVDERVTH